MPLLQPLPRAATLALALALVTAPLAAQTSRADPTDFQSWIGAGLDVDLPKKWEGSLDWRGRFQNDASTWRGSYITTELGRDLPRRLTAFASYRLALVDDGTYHRYALGAEQKAGLRGTTLALRVMGQYQQQNFEGDDETSSDTDAFVRTRLEVERGVTRSLEVYASTEPYFKLGGGSDYPIDNWRNTLGAKWEYREGRTLDLFYIYRPDYGKSYNRAFHIVGVDFVVDVKPFGKK